jgi:hypothetical protein
MLKDSAEGLSSLGEGWHHAMALLQPRRGCWGLSHPGSFTVYVVSSTFELPPCV